jgi:hypothetical protein
MMSIKKIHMCFVFFLSVFLHISLQMVHRG